MREESKLPHPATARSLYTSAWFHKARDLIEASGARWFVLSSRYGLVAPETEIAPYDYTPNTLGVAERRLWAAKVLEKLVPEIRDERHVVMLAGARYREFLIEPLERLGLTVVVPMAHSPPGVFARFARPVWRNFIARQFTKAGATARFQSVAACATRDRRGEFRCCVF